MLRRMLMVGTVAAMVLSAQIAGAQDQKKQRGAGQGQGRGGFGGGFFGGMGGSGAMLLGIAEVQKELSISEEQKGLIEDMQSDLREQMQQGRRNFNPGDFQNMSEEERTKLFEEGRKRMEEFNKKADEMVSMILDPKQVDRLGQLRLQQEGPPALARADIAKKMALSEAQQEKVKKVLEDSGTAVRELFSNMANASQEERQQAFTKMGELRKKASEDTLDVLSTEQKEVWEKMLGKKFEFPQPRGFGRPPGGGNPREKSDTKKGGA